MNEDAAVVALGSNLGGRFGRSEDALAAAVAALAQAGRLLAVSRLWRSSAWPDPADPPFLNAVALVEGLGAPRAALVRLGAIERAIGRERSGPNAPRVIDLDLIAVGQARACSTDLILPHPRAAERRFVMGPLAELLPDLRLPGQVLTVSELAVRAQIGADAAPLEGAHPPFGLRCGDGGDCVRPAEPL